MSKAARIVFAITLLIFACAESTSAQTAGQNVNMVSGTDWTTGDPFLQRQNEPSLAVSTRNPAHLLGSANDYRAVDIPGVKNVNEPGEPSGSRGDAWLGIYKSFDNGQTWRSALMPGYPQDTSPEGLSSPTHGFQAGADATVRAGTNGLFYVSGIVFNRNPTPPNSTPDSAVFVTRYIDNNNRENGDPTAKAGGIITSVAPTDSIRFAGTKLVARGSGTQFVDKPWIAVDVPRGNATCTVPTTNPDGTTVNEVVPAGAVYLTYTSISTTGTTNIFFTRSLDCGVSWSKPLRLSDSGDVNQGTVIAIDPSPSYGSAATIYVAWRRFGNALEGSAVMLTKSTNGGLTFTEAEEAIEFPKSCFSTPTLKGCPFDQGTSADGGSFRTNGYPTMTVDDTGRVYLAWAQRDVNSDAKVMMSVSADGYYWSPRTAVDLGPLLDDQGNPLAVSGRGHQFMPTLTFNTGKVMLAYYDLRQDHTVGVFDHNADYSQFAETRSSLIGGDPLSTDPFTAVFNPYITDEGLPPLLTGSTQLTVRRHTVDVQGSQASPAAPGLLVAPSFTSFRISHYLFGTAPDDTSATRANQLQVNPPNVPIFVQGTQPFIGDYIDIAGAPSFVFDGTQWRFNTAFVATPIFHAAWADNRDVIPPFDGDWTTYTPPTSASNPAGPHPSVFDPTQTVPGCSIDRTGMRNQNIYTSRISGGLVVTSPTNAKPLGVLPGFEPQLFQRAFTLILQNTTDKDRTFRITIPQQPANGIATVTQFAPFPPNLDVTVGAHLSAARPIFVASSVTTDTTGVQVDEIDAPSGNLVPGGLTASVTLNSDPTTPRLLEPATTTAVTSIAQFEVYNPAIANPAIANHTAGTPAIANPAIANPAIANPAIANPAIANPAIANVAALNPAIANPAIANLAVGNPAIANPAIANPAIANTPTADATYPLTNTGNTTASYAVKLVGTKPDGVNVQLIITKAYGTPTQENCEFKQVVNLNVVANVNNPVFATATNVTDPALTDPSTSNATVALAPGETANVTIRTTGTPDDLQSNVLNNVTPVAVAHAVNTQDAANGSTTPPTSLFITTNGTPPEGILGQDYPGFNVTIIGGTGHNTFTIATGSLPPGLQIDAFTGVITGTPTASGTFTFTIRVTDGVSTLTSGTITILVADPLLITTTALPDAVVNAPYTTALTSTGGTGAVTWSIDPTTSLPPGLFLNGATGVISGTPTAVNVTGTTFKVVATDSAAHPQLATQTLTIRVTSPLVVDGAGGALAGAIINQLYLQTLTSTGGIGPYTFLFSSGTLPAGLQVSGNTITGTPTGPSGSFTFTIKVTDSSQPPQTAFATFTISVASPLTILTSTFPDGFVGVPYAQTVATNGGTPPLVFSITGPLPAGLTFSAGTISGTPTVATTTTFTISVSDAGHPTQSASRVFSLRVNAKLKITTTMLPNPTLGAMYSQTLMATGGVTPYVWSYTGTLPTGLTLNPATGLLSGTAMAPGTFIFTVKVADSGVPQQTATQSFTLTVAAKYKLSFYVQPSSSSPGSQITPAVKVLVVDSSGYAVRGAVVNMTLAQNPGGAVLGGTTTATTGNNGIAIFASQSLNKSGVGYQMQANLISPAGGAAPALSVLFNVK